MDVDNVEPGTQTKITQGSGGSNQIIHIRQDSATELEALFNTVLNPIPNSKSKSLPMRARNLPKSFFLQPDRPHQTPHYHHSHSKSMGVLGGVAPVQINHSRSSSSDSNASLAGIAANANNNNTSVASPGMPTGSPMNGGINQKVAYGLSPAQRRAVAHNQFNNPRHNLHIPQVAHNRSKSSPASLQLLDVTSLQVKASDVPPDMPLPPGWEAAKTADGQQYFMNHSDRTTTWEDPRIVIIKQQRQTQLLQSQSVIQQNMSGQPPPVHDNNNIPANVSLDEQPLPMGWEQATTGHGEIYFINHVTKTTSWSDPRLQNVQQQSNSVNQPNNTQLQQQLIKMNQMDLSGGQGRGGMPQKSMLKHLVQEKEYLMRRQIMKQQLSNNGIDPFLGSNNSIFHQRDASLDSGVGMGSNYSLPRTPDDYLGNVEEMDIGDVSRRMPGGQTPHMVPTSNPQPLQHGHVSNPHFPDFLDTLPASNVDFASPNNNNPINQPQPGIDPASVVLDGTQPRIHGCPDPASVVLDGNDFIPTLHDTLPDDFDVESVFSHVKTENVDNMIWL